MKQATLGILGFLALLFLGGFLFRNGLRAYVVRASLDAMCKRTAAASRTECQARVASHFERCWPPFLARVSDPAAFSECLEIVEFMQTAPQQGGPAPARDTELPCPAQTASGLSVHLASDEARSATRLLPWAGRTLYVFEEPLLTQNEWSRASLREVAGQSWLVLTLKNGERLRKRLSDAQGAQWLVVMKSGKLVTAQALPLQRGVMGDELLMAVGSAADLCRD